MVRPARGRGGQDRRSLGMRLTERFLLPFTGPADVGDGRRATPVSDVERARGEDLARRLRRAPGPDGRVYLVADEDVPGTDGDDPPAAPGR